MEVDYDHNACLDTTDFPPLSSLRSSNTTTSEKTFVSSANLLIHGGESPNRERNESESACTGISPDSNRDLAKMTANASENSANSSSSKMLNVIKAILLARRARVDIHAVSSALTNLILKNR